jgi:hypothetical protein
MEQRKYKREHNNKALFQKNTSDLKFSRIPIAYDVFCRQYITKTYTLLTEAFYTTIQEMFHFIILRKTHITGGVV